MKKRTWHGRPLKKYETWTTSPELVDYIRAESRRHTVEEITAMLNDMGKKSGKGKPLTLSIVRGIQYHYKIPSLKQHLKSIGYLTTEEKAKAHNLNIYKYLNHLLEHLPVAKMTDSELSKLAPWAPEVTSMCSGAM